MSELALNYADTPGAQPLLGAAREKHISYSAHLRVTPIRGKRFEVIRNLEQIANDVQLDLSNIDCGTIGFSFDFTEPVAFTHQFANKPARINFYGHICKLVGPDETFTKTPVGTRTIVHSGQFKTGPGASTRPRRQPNTQLDTLVAEFKDTIEAATALTMFRLELARVIYGDGGFHFPR